MNDLLKYFIENKKDVAKALDITVYGYQFKYDYLLINSACKYLFEDFVINEEYMIPKGLENRPGLVFDKHYIVVHDTASSAPTGNGLAHAKYVSNGGGGTSWHYTASSDGIYHHIPDTENAYHAGDGGRDYIMYNSNVFGNNLNPVVTISSDGFYEIDGVKSKVLAPTNDGEILTTDKINDKGIRILNSNGEYLIGNTYYNKSYKLIANCGGNKNSVGIESCINQGSDIYYTWQKLAKLVAHLMKDLNLTINDVKPHHYFSGKPCPMTMRKAGMWDEFIELVVFEYDMITKFKDYKVSFKSSNLEYINDLGRIIKLPENDLLVDYTIVTEYLGKKEEVTLCITIPGKNK